MKKIGLIGEDPNDTTSVAKLLEKKYKGQVQFVALAKRIRGYQLNNDKIKKILPIEFASQKCKLVIFIRDLDAFKSQGVKVTAVNNWFKAVNSTINNQGILLNNIWELEALIFADIETFNLIYNISHKFKGDPTMIKEPKEKLMELTSGTRKQYRESHCPEIFEKLSIDTVEKNCAYFREFITAFDEKIKK